MIDKNLGLQRGSSRYGTSLKNDARYDPKTGEEIKPFGYELNPDGSVKRDRVKPRTPGKDYGADPLGGGKFKMVPSGDVVDTAERNRRLS